MLMKRARMWSQSMRRGLVQPVRGDGPAKKQEVYFLAESRLASWER